MTLNYVTTFERTIPSLTRWVLSVSRTLATVTILLLRKNNVDLTRSRTDHKNMQYVLSLTVGKDFRNLKTIVNKVH